MCNLTLFILCIPFPPLCLRSQGSHPHISLILSLSQSLESCACAYVGRSVWYMPQNGSAFTLQWHTDRNFDSVCMLKGSMEGDSFIQKASYLVKSPLASCGREKWHILESNNECLLVDKNAWKDRILWHTERCMCVSVGDVVAAIWTESSERSNTHNIPDTTPGSHIHIIKENHISHISLIRLTYSTKETSCFRFKIKHPVRLKYCSDPNMTL